MARGLSLTAATCGFVAAALVVSATAAGGVLFARSDGMLDGALDEAVRLRTEAAGSMLAQSLDADWRDLGALASFVETADEDATRAYFDGLSGDNGRVSWVGHADVSGRVMVASRGMLDGADVSQRPWFREGLRGGFAGDVHEAVLLASLLAPDGDDPIRFIDLARPVGDVDGQVTGVVAMHIDATWLSDFLAEAGRLLEIDLYLIAADGTIRVTPGGVAPTEGDLAILGAARTGQASSGREVWPDGETYFTALLPAVAHGDLPSFGWRLAGRIEADTFTPRLSTLLSGAAAAGAVALAILAALTAAFVGIFVRPITRLSEAAARLSEGEEAYPPESGSTREAARLSRALAHIQSEWITRP